MHLCLVDLLYVVVIQYYRDLKMIYWMELDSHVEELQELDTIWSLLSSYSCNYFLFENYVQRKIIQSTLILMSLTS